MAGRQPTADHLRLEIVAVPTRAFLLTPALHSFFGAVLFAGAVHSAEAAPGARFEIFPEQMVQRSSNHWVSTAYVIDKTANRFWVCAARFNFDSEAANAGDCVGLAADIGRPQLTERYQTEAITGSAAFGPHLPVFWFIEPANGDVQFCAPRHPGVCVQMKLP
jgi:hypothetical protein